VIRVKEVDDQSEEIQVKEDVITYPCSDRNCYLDRIVQHVLTLIAGIHMTRDHVRDHWKIESFYYHTRKEQTLAVQYPELAEEWGEKNTDKPEDVSPGLTTKRWWKCPKCHREYQASVYNRTHRHSRCPHCAHKKATPETCLATVFPEIASEWDYEKNAPLKPTDVLPGTDKRVWWKCGQGHRWQARIYTRTGPKGTKCPFCQGRAVDEKNSLVGKTLVLAAFWHPSKKCIYSRGDCPLL